MHLYDCDAFWCSQLRNIGMAGTAIAMFEAARLVLRRLMGIGLCFIRFTTVVVCVMTDVKRRRHRLMTAIARDCCRDELGRQHKQKNDK